MQRGDLNAFAVGLTRIGVHFLDRGRLLSEGLDCFGLFLYVMSELGLELPDFEYTGTCCYGATGENLLALHYYEFADEVKREEIVEGDVVFFSYGSSSPGRSDAYRHRASVWSVFSHGAASARGGKD